MANGFGGIFEDPSKGRNPFAAPGIHANVLSGNPAATVTNLAAVVGAGSGAAIADAIRGHAVNPQLMQQQRQTEFAQRFQQIHAGGKTTTGQSMRQAADAAFAENKLSPREYLNALSESQKLIDQDMKTLDAATKWVSDSQEVKDWNLVRSNFNAVNDLLKKENDTSAQAQAMLMSMKIMDPGVQVTQNEIRWAENQARGQRYIDHLLSSGLVTVKALNDFIVSGGKKLTLNAEQKKRWMSSLAEVTQERRAAATRVYEEAASRYGAGGERPMQPFEAALSNVRDNLTNYSPEEVVKATTYGFGTDPGTHRLATEREVRQFMTDAKPMIRAAATMAQGLGGDVLDELLDRFADLRAKTPEQEFEQQVEGQVADTLEMWDRHRAIQYVETNAREIYHAELAKRYPEHSELNRYNIDSISGAPVAFEVAREVMRNTLMNADKIKRAKADEAKRKKRQERAGRRRLQNSSGQFVQP